MKARGIPGVRAAARLAVLGIMLVLAACSSVRPFVGAARMQQLQAAQAAGEWRQVLVLARAEMAQPTLDTPDYQADLRSIAIGAQASIAFLYGFDDAFDAEQARYLAEGLNYARSDGRRASQLRVAAANYYMSSRRAGRALPLLLDDLAYQRSVAERYQEVRALDALASAYNDMGEGALRDAYRQAALRSAEPVFAATGPSAPSDYLWLQYKAMLEKALSDAAERRDLPRMAMLWAKIEPISLDKVRPAAVSYLVAAREYIIAGDLERAHELVRQGRAQWERERAGSSEQTGFATDLVCTDVMESVARRDKGAAAKARECLAGLQSLGRGLQIGTLMQSGLAFEVAGDDPSAASMFDEAITRAESLRGSFTVAERAAFFRSDAVRKAYWGRIRVAARAARDAGDAAEPFYALVAKVEGVRARQLGDRIGSSANVEGAAIARYADALGPGDAVVGYVVMEDATLVTAFARGARQSAFVPLGRVALEERVRMLLPMLSDPRSDVRAIERAMQSLSSELLGPVAPLLAGRTQVTFVPDGPLALLPPTLFSLERTYQPLGLQAQVSQTPAVRLLMRSPGAAPARAALWALADPAYPRSVAALEGDAGHAVGVPPAQLLATRGRLRASSGGTVAIPRLPETRAEVEAIARMFGGSSARLNVGADASKSALQHADLRGYAYLHLATHGVLAGEVPGLGEPALVLAAGPKPEDAFLRASEAESLAIDAQVTVLSACSTGSGTVYSGEGVMSMSRAFLIAGSRNVVMSLWPVESRTTVDLMVAMYAANRKGAPIAAALRSAMMQVRSTRPHPMYWAPFVVVRS